MKKDLIARIQAPQLGKIAGRRTMAALVLIGAVGTAAFRADACTSFSIGASPEKVFGKSYDWNMSHGFVVINKRNMSKTAFALMPGDKPVSWTSKFGSLTFNQYGREFPNGGINEAGLVLEVMILGETKYPDASSGLPTVNELQWIQYQLDRFETVSEIAQHAGDLRISKVQSGVHYLACDRSGSCASIEWISGRPVVHSGAQMPYQTLANSTYVNSLAEIRNYQGFGGSKPVPPRASGSLERFVRASASVKDFDPSRGPSSDQAFNILESVGGTSSQWQIVYESETGRAHFRTLPYRAIKSIDATAFNYDCNHPVQVFDMDASQGGDVTDDFSDYTEQKNRVVVEKALKGTLPAFAIEKAVKYPSTTVCNKSVY